jgi:ABC-type glycerol-3-phosphate transport system substrate-binding protein
MMAEQKVFLSGPGAVRGKAPVVTKTVPVKSSTPAKPKAQTNQITKISQGITKDLGKVSELIATYLGGGTDVVTPPITPVTPSTGTDDALLQAILAGQQTAAANAAAQAQAERQSAYDILLSEFTR